MFLDHHLDPSARMCLLQTLNQRVELAGPKQPDNCRLPEVGATLAPSMAESQV